MCLVYQVVPASLEPCELLDDDNPDVIASAGTGLGHRLMHKAHTRAVSKLVPLASHDNTEVRMSVACALGSIETDDAITALIQLSQDTSDSVRDWAVFALGSQIEKDTPQIREALKNCLMDTDFNVRGEAFIGLAERSDLSILNDLKSELDTEFEGTYAIRASELLADASLLPHLNALKQRYASEMSDYHLSCLEDAIKACSASYDLRCIDVE